MSMKDLFQPLQELATDIENNVACGKPTCVCAGQRSGKTTLLHELARGKKVAFAGMVPVESVMFAEASGAQLVDANLGPDAAVKAGAELVILEEVFWRDSALPLFDSYVEDGRLPVIAMGSASNVDAMVAWGSRVTHVFATWELNPLMPKYSLERDRVGNPLTWFRDFASYKFRDSGRRIVHVVAGDDDWEPTIEELSELSSLFATSARDPAWAAVATRTGVKVVIHHVDDDQVLFQRVERRDAEK